MQDNLKTLQDKINELATKLQTVEDKMPTLQSNRSLKRIPSIDLNSTLHLELP